MAMFLSFGSMDTVYIFPEEFPGILQEGGSFWLMVIILDLTQLNFQLETVTM